MNKAVFLDRDGVINKEVYYLHKIEEFEFVDGIFDLCRYFQKRGFLLVVITNQAGIARGIYSETDFHKLTDWMIEKFRENKITIHDVFFCPFHPDGIVERYKKSSQDRKPNPGMILKARNKYDINLAGSILIGDKESDIEAGRNAGVGCNVLFAAPRDKPDETRADLVVTDLRKLPAALT